jgi:peptide deformylase
MAARQILRYPHPALKRVARPVGDDESALAERVAGDLVDTMRANPGCVGLAAPQIDELVRIAAVDVSEHPEAPPSNGLLVLVNPTIPRSSGEEVAREGCFSIPDLTANVKRATEVLVRARMPAGAAIEVESVGFEARCVQHELDHLDGILFLDRVHSLATDVFQRKRPPPGTA